MSDPNDLAAFLGGAWEHLERGVADSRSPARFPTFGTVALDGAPELRTVALRRADRHAALFEVHTDIATPKITALTQNPVASLHVWLPEAQLQIRLRGRVEIRTGPEVDAEWAKVPVASRVSYGTMPIPGTPIDHVHSYDKPALRDRFAVLTCHLTDVDLVHLETPHRRAVYSRDTGWQGTWVAP
jgi:hypothetical protein